MFMVLLGTLGSLGAGLLVHNQFTSLNDEKSSLSSKVASQASTIATLRNTIISYNANNPNSPKVPLPIITFSVAPQESDTDSEPTLESENPTSPVQPGEPQFPIFSASAAASSEGASGSQPVFSGQSEVASSEAALGSQPALGITQDSSVQQTGLSEFTPLIDLGEQVSKPGKPSKPNWKPQWSGKPIKPIKRPSVLDVKKKKVPLPLNFNNLKGKTSIYIKCICTSSDHE